MIRAYEDRDEAAVLAVNEANVPEVGAMDADLFASLRRQALSVDVVEVDGEIVGFMILLGVGADYASPNYAWFSQRHDAFVYVDRIAISEAARGKGFGPALYQRFEQVAVDAGVAVMAAEVNTVPPNPRSLRFHRLFGFDEIERRRPYAPDLEVVMLEKVVVAPTSTSGGV